MYLPRWMDGLEYDHPVKAALYDALAARPARFRNVPGGDGAGDPHGGGARGRLPLAEIDLGSGMVACELQFPESLYYDILSGKTGFDITGRVSSWSCSRSWPR